MIKYGLKEEQIIAIQNILAQHEEVEQAILFGSRAKGNYRPASDIDLVLKGEKLNITIQNKIANKLDDLLLPYIFDLSVFHQISNIDLLEHIERVGVEFYENELDFTRRINYTLGQLCEKIGSGSTPRGGKEVYLDKGEYSLIRSQNVLDFFFSMNGLVYIDKKQAKQLNNVAVKENDVLLNITGDSVARVCQVPKYVLPARVNQHVAIIRPKPDVLSATFLKYYLLTPEYKNKLLSFASVGATRNALTKVMIEDLEIDLPGIKVQQKIATILSSLDDKIELNRQTNQTLEEIAKTLFREMCVPKGDELPEGWRLGKVREICDVNKSSVSKRDSFDIIEYIEISAVNKGVIGNVDVYDFIDAPSRARRKLKHGDTVISTVRPNRGSYFLAVEPSNNLIASTGFSVFTPNGVPFSFLYILLTSDEKLAYYGHVADGAAYPSINPNIVMDMDLAIPSQKSLSVFHKLTEPIFYRISKNTEQTQNLTLIKEYFLPRLMSGSIII